MEPSNNLKNALQKVTEAINQLLFGRSSPIVVAVDGGSGAGKSSFAYLIRNQFDAALIPLDDFFAADIPDSQWDRFTIEERLRRVFDWRRLRENVLVPLRAGKPAKWYAFDFTAGLRSDGTYGMQTNPIIQEPARVILLEGAYSAYFAIADLVDLTVVVDTPVDKRHRRIASREDKDFLRRWHQRWDSVEKYYFTHVRPNSSFDIVVNLE
jgi:uridine kinase